MLYKRTEYFRYTFGKPLEAEFRIVVENGTDVESSPGECHLHGYQSRWCKAICEVRYSC